MMQLKAISFLALMVLNGLCEAKLSGPESVAKPQQKIVEEDFHEAMTGSGVSRKLGTLGTCQSDCDRNSDCDSGLVCWQRRTNDPLPPCCSGSQPSDSRDFCVPSGCSSGGGGGGAGGGGDVSVDVGIIGGIACFSGGTIVDVFEKGSTPMRDLRVGDQILSAVSGHPHKQHYQPVYSFAHYHPTSEATFLVIHTDDEKSLKITGDHLIFVEGKANPVRASSILPGDRLTPSGAEVTSIGATVKRGIYAPLTPDATFLLNDGAVQVSSYAALVQSADEEYATFRDGTKFMAQHTGVHMVLTPYRMWCRATGSFKCDSDSYNEQGMPHYIAGGISILARMDEQYLMIQVILFLVAFPFFGTMLLIENVAFSGPLIIFGLGIVGKVLFGRKTSGLNTKAT